MATSSGTTTSFSGSDPQEEMDKRKKRRMISNRESARRSRMRKQKHLDDLTTQLSHLRNENNQIMSNISMTTQHYMNVEAENSVLRAQVAELGHRLQSLNEIIGFMKQPMINDGDGFLEDEYNGSGTELGAEFLNNSLSYLYSCQPILASADMIMY
uniref:bZIP transcription factor 11-like n=1 Tax=Erigeron canadensis TaxID=72917 RepID=UPI001CB96CB5|nr:bZIP transcription factor 11-like [Erigeron canadensis]